MSYTTVEVEIVHGKVTPVGPENLPESGRGLLTILPGSGADNRAVEFLQAFEELQRLLQVDEAKAKAWLDSIRDARR